MRDRNYFIGCLLQVITHTSLTQVCVYDTLRQSGFASFTQNSHKLPKKECQSKKKTTQTASLRGFLAGAVRIELTTRGFGDRCSTCWAIPLQNWWAIGDSNPGPTGYEPVALTNWANGPRIMIEIYSSQEEPDCCSFLMSAFIYLSRPSPAKYFRRIWA